MSAAFKLWWLGFLAMRGQHDRDRGHARQSPHSPLGRLPKTLHHPRLIGTRGLDHEAHLALVDRNGADNIAADEIAPVGQFETGKHGLNLLAGN